MTKKQIHMGSLVGLAIVALLVVRRAAAAVGPAITPTNPDNLAYTGVNAVGDVLNDGTDNGNFNLGSYIYDIYNPHEINIDNWGKFQ